MQGTVVVNGSTPPPTQSTSPPPPATPAPAPAPAAPKPAAATPTTARPTTTTALSTTTVAPTTTLAPPPIAEPTATSTTALQASGDVALPAQKTSSSGDDLNPALVVLAIALAAGAAGGTFWVRRRAAQPSG